MGATGFNRARREQAKKVEKGGKYKDGKRTETTDLPKSTDKQDVMLEDLTVQQLKELAKSYELEIAGLKKVGLIEIISAHQATLGKAGTE